MRNKELKKLANIRLLLLALAVILTVQTAAAGWYCFIKPNSSKSAPAPAETTEVVEQKTSYKEIAQEKAAEAAEAATDAATEAPEAAQPEADGEEHPSDFIPTPQPGSSKKDSTSSTADGEYNDFDVPQAADEANSPSNAEVSSISAFSAAAPADLMSSAPAAQTDSSSETSSDVPSTGMLVFFWVSLALLIVDIVAFLLVSIEINNLVMQGKVERKYRRWLRKAAREQSEEAAQDEGKTVRAPEESSAPAAKPAPAVKPAAVPVSVPKTMEAPASTGYLSVGKAHNIGRRSYQQDSFGHCKVMNDQGLLAVVADGMGGLQGGEKVSQEIVMQCLSAGSLMRPEAINTALSDMVNIANNAVNKMLGPDGLYKSGSTLVSVLVKDHQLMWISVGDSRIYLYRNGAMTQLSQDHDLLQEWMPDIRSGKIRYEDAVASPDARKLTSFIGMGNLRYIDRNAAPLQLQPGDRVLLMSDGVYGTIPDEEMAAVLAHNPDVQQAASILEKKIEQVNLSYQDNYTVLIVAI